MEEGAQKSTTARPGTKCDVAFLYRLGHARLKRIFSSDLRCIGNEKQTVRHGGQGDNKGKHEQVLLSKNNSPKPERPKELDSPRDPEISG